MSSRFSWIGIIVALVLVNLLASFFHARIDLTEEKRFTLSQSTKQMVSELEEPVYIDVFLEGDFPAGFKKLANAVEETLQEFKQSGRSRIVYQFHDPLNNITDGVTYADSLAAMGAVPINLTVQLSAGEQQQYVFPIAWVRYKDRSMLVELYSGGKRFITPEEMNVAESQLEYRFINAIDKLVNTNRPIVGYSVGNGQPVGPEVQDLIENTLRPNFQLFTLNLNDQPFIPDTFKVILIVKPTISFTEQQKLKLDQYIMRGGKIIWSIDNLAAEMDSLQSNAQTIAYERNLNLTDLFFRYGARINPDLIMDLQCDFLPFIVGGTQENPQYEFLKWNYFPLFESPSNHPINRNLRLVSGRFVNSIDTVSSEGIKKTVLLKSSTNSRTIGSPALISLNENRNAAEDDLYKQNGIPAAILLEGAFRSLYDNRISKANQDSMRSMGYEYLPRAPQSSKMVLIGDGDIFLNEFSIRQAQILPMGMNQYTIGTQYEYQFANRDFLLNSIEYLVSDLSIIETRNKEFTLRLLDARRTSAEKLNWQLLNIAVPILLIIVIGLIFQAIRKYKYR